MKCKQCTTEYYLPLKDNSLEKENELLRFALMDVANTGNTGDNPVDIACDALLDGQRSHLQKVVDEVGGSLNGGPRADGLSSTLIITYDSDGDENE